MPSKSKKILIAEDEPSIVFTLKDTLESEGYDVHVVEDGELVVPQVLEERPDLILLDLMMPGRSGFDICKDLRERKLTTPIIMLTAKDQEVDKVLGLTLGADDYMTKPFGVKELLARIQASLRRANSYSVSGPLDMISLGDIRIDLTESIVFRPEGELDLTTREVELIRYLMTRANEPITRDDLLEHVWRYEYSTNTRTVDVHISKLRSKIEMIPDEPRYLVTLHGVGYMMKLG